MKALLGYGRLRGVGCGRISVTRYYPFGACRADRQAPVIGEKVDLKVYEQRGIHDVSFFNGQPPAVPVCRGRSTVCSWPFCALAEQPACKPNPSSLGLPVLVFRDLRRIRIYPVSGYK